MLFCFIQQTIIRNKSMKQKNRFNKYFENENLIQVELYSLEVIKALIRSILEPLASTNTPSIVFTYLEGIEGIDSLVKRLEYSKNIILRNFNSFEFEKFDVEKTGFIVLNSKRYNCAFLFNKKEDNTYEIYLKLNSKLVCGVYETIKNIFLINYDEKFYEFHPERRENELVNCAVLNIIKQFQESIKESEYNSKIQQNYKTITKTNETLRNEIYASVKQIAHEIKNQLSILDIYTRIFEKKTGDTETTEPIKKSVALIKSQIEQFKNFDIVNLSEKNIKAIIQDSIRMYSTILKEKNNKIVLIDKIPNIEANAFVDSEKFLIVINNIIKNAHDSTKNDDIIIKIEQIETRIKISIINHGQQIDKNNQKRIFDQGYTTKKEGWGVGLAVCKKYIDSQFGILELEKSDEKETIFSLFVPVANIE